MLREAQIKKAISANRYYAHFLAWSAGSRSQTGWVDRYPAICSYVGAPMGDERAFAIAIAAWQGTCGGLVIDGIIGEKTWRQLQPVTAGVRAPAMRDAGPFAPNRQGMWAPPFTPTETGSSLALPGQGFMFVFIDVLPDMGKNLIRKVAVIPKDFTMRPLAPFGTLRPGAHAQGGAVNLRQSPWMSTSNRPFGAPNFNGNPLLIDIAAVERAGGRVLSVQELVADLQRIANAQPSSANRIKTLIDTVRRIEGETLVQASNGVRGAPLSQAHSAYVRQAEAYWKAFDAKQLTRNQLVDQLSELDRGYRNARMVGRVGRAFVVLGVVLTAVDISVAANESYKQQSIRPIAAETVRQVGGWGMAFAGAKIGGLGGAALGIETGPGAIITGAIGAIIFGAAGYFGADWVADRIHEN